MKTIDFSYFIERYNTDKMDEAEKKWFEKELEGNVSLLREVQLRKKTDNILKKHDVISLRNKLSAIEKVRKESVLVSKNRKPINIRYAAIFAGAVLIGSLILMIGKYQSKEALFNKFYKLYEIPASSRSSGYIALSTFNKALELYNNKEFQSASVLFEQILKNDPGNMQSEFLYGMSSMENKIYPDAETSFRKVILNNNNLYIEDAEWYLALCYIKTNASTEARKQLLIIKNSGSIHKNDAEKILRKLK